MGGVNNVGGYTCALYLSCGTKTFLEMASPSRTETHIDIHRMTAMDITVTSMVNHWK
jgi:hypothetical protein